MPKASKARNQRRGWLRATAIVTAMATTSVLNACTPISPDIDLGLSCQMVADFLPTVERDEPKFVAQFREIQSFAMADAYATVWQLRLQAAGFAHRPVVQDSAQLSTFLASLVGKPEAATIGDEAAQILAIAMASLALSAEERRPVYDSILRYSSRLQNGDLFAAVEGAAGQEIAAARVVIALTAIGAEVPQDVSTNLLTIASNQRHGSSLAEKQASVLTWAASQGIDPDTYNDERKGRPDIVTGWVVEVLSRPVTLETLPLLSDFVSYLGADSLPGMNVRLAPEIEKSNGWFYVAGTSSPDPQLTFYIRSIAAEDALLDLASGVPRQGWLPSLSARSLPNSAYWAWMLSTCGLVSGPNAERFRDSFDEDDSVEGSVQELHYWAIIAEATMSPIQKQQQTG